MINRIIYQVAPEERPETCIRFAEGETPTRSRPFRLATHFQAVPWVMSSFSTGLPSSPKAMGYCLAGFRPARKILSILLILSKNRS